MKNIGSAATSRGAVPGYAWVCHVCEASNPAGQGDCTGCGNASHISMAQVAAARGAEKTTRFRLSNYLREVDKILLRVRAALRCARPNRLQMKNGGPSRWGAVACGVAVVLSGTLLWANGSPQISGGAAPTATPRHLFTRIHCKEKWFDHAWRGSDDFDYKWSPTCETQSSTFKPLGDWYWLADGKVYFRSVRTEQSSDCGGRGVGAMGNMLNPLCHLPTSLQRHDHYETRSFWLTSTDGAGFRLAPTRHPKPHSPRMAMALQRYGVDGRSAYFNGDELVGADAKTFEVIFPFEEDESLRDFEFAIDGKHIFINEWTLPRFDPSRIEWLVVPCAKDSPTLLPERCQEPLVRSLGRVGDDLLYMSRSPRPTLFRGLAEPDLRCEEVAKGFECRSRRRTFVIRVDYPEPPTVESMTEQPARQHRHR